MTTENLDLLADDLLDAAEPFLPAGAAASILGVELDLRPTIAFLVSQGDDPPRAVARYPATVDHADLVGAARELANAWANTLDQDVVQACGYAGSKGAHWRIYIGRDSREMALAIADGRRIAELARRTIDTRATLN